MEGKAQNASGSSSVPATPGSSGQATVAITVDLLKMLLQSANPDINADILLANAGIVPTPPPVAEPAASTGAEGSAAELIEEVPRVTQKETEQPLLTLEEVVVNVSKSDTEATDKSTEKEPENPTERAIKITTRIAEEREVPTVAREEGRKGTTPRDEAVAARATTVHTYQRRPTRTEAPRKTTTKEPQNKAPEKKTEEED